MLRKHIRCSIRSNQIRSLGTKSVSSWQPLNIVSSLENFRKECFMPSKPCLLSSEEFASLPAIPKWFRNNLQQPGRWVMNLDYLSQYGHAMVPLELTRLPSPTSSRSDNNFLRSKAPLSLFLEWTTKAEENTLDRLYLAQAPLSDLPKELQDDLPAPKFVRESGNGDIYDVNIWIGMPPTYTPLHRDPNPNLFIQLVGEKTVRLMEPAIGGEIFEASQQLLRQSNSSIFRGNEMMVGREKETLEGVVWDLPRDAESQKDGRASLSVRHQGGYEAHLKSSDGLFIPQGWWHSIKGVGDGITGSVNWWFR